tara:strand:+ start:434 stop:1555 length:1122 start_codon:yes stop_codon:yes gene_type:complete
MSMYRAAVIGLGRMGSTYDDEVEHGGTVTLPYCHGPSYYYSPRTELISGADPHPEQRSMFGERWDISEDRLYTDYKEMIEREQLDIVSVTTTAKIRASIVKDVARSGVKAIWAEKPIAFSLEEADEMLEVCNDNGVVLALNTARRWMSSYTEIKQILDSGKLGQILQITGYWRCGLSHNGSHLIDIIRFLAGGNIEWVFGEMSSDQEAELDDDLEGNGYLAFDNGVRAFLRSMDCGNAVGTYIDVICESGRIVCKEGSGEYLVYQIGSGIEGTQRKGESPVVYPVPLPARPQGTGLTIIEDLISSMDNNTKPRASIEDGIASLEIAIALRESHRKGGVKVKLPISDRSLGIRSNETLKGDIPARIRRQLENGS